MDPSEGSVNETYLEYLDNQIKNWQDYRTLHTDVIAAFYSWRASFVRLLQVEVICGIIFFYVLSGWRHNNVRLCSYLC